MNVLNFPNHITPKTLKDEKKYIASGLQQKLLDRHVWHVISWSWFSQWKDYVDFDDVNGDNNDKDREHLKPGPIDNNMIRNEIYTEDELKVGITEGLDYVLLPETHGKYLYEKYKGGPFFKRLVINVATIDHPLLQIELYPIRVEIYYMDKNKVITVDDVNQYVYKQDHLLLKRKSDGNGSSKNNHSSMNATANNNGTNTATVTTTPTKINNVISSALSTLTTSVSNGIHLVTNTNHSNNNNTLSSPTYSTAISSTTKTIAAVTKPYHVQYVSKKDKYEVTLKSFQTNTARKYMGACRSWVRYPYKQNPQQQQQQQQNISKNEINDNASNSSSMDIIIAEASSTTNVVTSTPTNTVATTNTADTTAAATAGGRKMTRDITDWDNNFKCVCHYPKSLTFYDLLTTTTTVDDDHNNSNQSLAHQQQQQQQQYGMNGENETNNTTDIDVIKHSGINNNRVILLVEYSEAVSNISTTASSSANNNNGNTYPRNAILNKWKSQLCVGDVVDGCDRSNKWYESVVMKVHAPPTSNNNSIVVTTSTAAATSGYSYTIHFKGWEHKFDEIFSKIDQLTKLQPLYTRTTDWRSVLQENDKIEVNIGFSAYKSLAGNNNGSNNNSNKSSTTDNAILVNDSNTNNITVNNDMMNVDTHTASLQINSANNSPSSSSSTTTAPAASTIIVTSNNSSNSSTNSGNNINNSDTEATTSKARINSSSGSAEITNYTSTTQPVSLPVAWWIQGEVEEVDLAGSRVLVKLLKSVLTAVLLNNTQKNANGSTTANTSSSINTATSTTAGSIDVDMKLDIDSTSNSNSSDDVTKTNDTITTATNTTSTIDSVNMKDIDDNTTAAPVTATESEIAATTTTTTAATTVTEADLYIKQWYDLYGELICPLNTHITTVPHRQPSFSTHLTGTSGGSGKGGFQMGSPSRFKNSALNSSLLSNRSNINRFSSIGNNSSISSNSSTFSSNSINKKNDDEDDVDYGDSNVKGKPIAKGVVGLQNLGNTCFMNSVLQCLSNTYNLTEYFLEGKYKEEINVDNALGHGGKLAQVYAKLIREMWSDAYTKVIPRAFKQTIGEFQPQFAGYQQQDSQELMGFLLDGLHEDLNRRLKKPAVSKIESNGRSDELIARESWRRFLLRNDSVLVDKVYGQLRSHVTCMNCGKESVTFDPFNTLSLPVPIKTSKPLTVLYRPLGSNSNNSSSLVPLRVTIDIEMTDQIKDVKTKVITKLLKLGKISAPTIVKVTSAATVNQVSSSHISDDVTKNTSNNDGTSAIIDENEEDSDGYVKVDINSTTAGTTSSTIHNNNESSHTTHTTTADDITTAHVIEYILHRTHAASISSYNQSKINKSLIDKCPAADFTHGREIIILYQLQYPCELKNISLVHTTVNTLSSSSSSSSFNRRLNSSDDEDDDTIKNNGGNNNENTTAVPIINYTYMDMYNGKLTQLAPTISTSAFIETFGLPLRFNISTEISGLELYQLVWNQVFRFVKTDSIYYYKSSTSIVSSSSNSGNNASNIANDRGDENGNINGDTQPPVSTVAYEFPFYLITSSIWANGVKSIIQPTATVGIINSNNNDNSTNSSSFKGTTNINGNSSSSNFVSDWSSNTSSVNNSNNEDNTSITHANATTTIPNKVRIVEGEVLVCCWKKEVDSVLHFDKIEFEKVDDIVDNEDEEEAITVVNGMITSGSTNNTNDSFMDIEQTTTITPSSTLLSSSTSPLNRTITSISGNSDSTPNSPLPNSDKKRLKADSSSSSSMSSATSSATDVVSNGSNSANIVSPSGSSNSDGGTFVKNLNMDISSTDDDMHYSNNITSSSSQSSNLLNNSSSNKSTSQGSSKSGKNSKKLSVYTCLDKFVEREQLNSEETLYCSQCKQHLAPVKKMDLWAVPDILIIQLKRFQYIPGQYFVHREKINDLIDFPLTGLNLSPYVLGLQSVAAPPVYDLYAVSLHSGGLGGGHYTAVAQNSLNGKWYNFNDSYVSEAAPSAAVCEQSYVLFYKRQQGSLQWAGVVPLEDPGLPDDV